MNRTDIVGIYRPCPDCAAPAVDPFPTDWTLELIKEGERVGPVTSFFTPHRPGCEQPPAVPNPGTALRVLGHHVVGLHITPPPVPADPLGLRHTDRMHTTDGPGFLFSAPISTDTPAGWTPLGHTDAGYVVTGESDIVWADDRPRPDRNVIYGGPPADLESELNCVADAVTAEPFHPDVVHLPPAVHAALIRASEWACTGCGYLNAGGVCTHCGQVPG